MSASACVFFLLRCSHDRSNVHLERQALAANGGESEARSRTPVVRWWSSAIGRVCAAGMNSAGARAREKDIALAVNGVSEESVENESLCERESERAFVLFECVSVLSQDFSDRIPSILCWQLRPPRHHLDTQHLTSQNRFFFPSLISRMHRAVLHTHSHTR